MTHGGYAATNRRYREREWTFDEAEVRALASAMVHSEYIIAATVLQDYYDTPYGWSKEHAWWVENDRTDDLARWDEAMDNGWEV